MNLGLISGRQPVAQPASHPYLQQLYAAAAAQQQAYGLTPNIMQLAGMNTGNPLLDMYSQYAAAAYSPVSPVAAVSQQMVPVTQATISSSLDQQQQQTQQSLMAGQNQAYAQALQYAYAPNMLTAQQLSAAGLATAGFPTYAAAAGPTPSPVQGQQQPTEQRIQ
jgi:hypothetical protein